MIDFASERNRISELSFSLRSAEQTVEREKQEQARAIEALHDAQAALEILQHLAQAVQQQVHQRISTVVSASLSSVFEDPYEFKIVFERKRGGTEAHLRFVRRGLDVDPLTASGGGMVDVAAFALRIACLVLHRPRLNRVVVMDEPFRFVSADYQSNVRAMIEQLARDMKVQLIFVTHNEAYSTGKVVEIR